MSTREDEAVPTEAAEDTFVREAPLLEAIVFVSGGVLLSLEMVASRVLAPHFGNSVYVWGSLIAVFLAALSVGYAAGGRLADQRPSMRTFVGLVFAGGVLVVPIPLVATPILGLVGRIDFGPKLNPLVGAVALFVVPSVVLGMVSPFAVRLRARDLRTVGRTAGSLYALGTVGSIVGTLLTSFVLVDYLGVRALILTMGILLMITATVGWMASRWRAGGALGGVASGLVLLLTLARGAAPSTALYTRDSVYHRISIVDRGSVRCLDLDDHPQSALDRANPRRSVYAYTSALHLPLIFVPEPKRVTLIGLGGGTVSSRYVQDYPGVALRVAEIDPEVVRAAERFFDLTPSERHRIEARDGRLQLRETHEPQEIILTDAYLADTLPVHLATREFFALARSRLTPDGVLASNVIGALEGSKSKLFRSVLRTIRDVFPTVYLFPVVTPGEMLATHTVRNIVLVATNAPRIDAEDVASRARALVEGQTVTVDGFVDLAARLYQTPIDTGDVPVLTDDFAPTLR